MQKVIFMSKKSFLSRIVEYILWKTKPEYMTSNEEIQKFLDNKSDEKFRSIFKTQRMCGMDVVSVGDKYDDDRIILYVHGGAYINQLNMQHQLYCYILSKILKIRIILPVYPLTPHHDNSECYTLITGLYEYLTEKYDHITMMGDSAGGGFVLSFCQYLEEECELGQPHNIITFSPWVDISMKNEYDDNEDPILGNVGLKEIGIKWAGKLSTTDYRVSPTYGKNTMLPRTLLFTGTNEIFYNDILEYYEKIADNGVDAELIVGEEMFHIYPLFPIPEAIGVLKKIKKEME